MPGDQGQAGGQNGAKDPSQGGGSGGAGQSPAGGATPGVQTGGGALAGDDPAKRGQMDDNPAIAQGRGGATLEGFGKAIDAAAEGLRKGDPPDPELLKQFDNNPNEYRSFVTKYKEMLDRQRAKATSGDSKDQQVQNAANAPGTLNLQGGTGVAAGLGGADHAAEVRQDQQRKLQEAQRANLSDELRRVSDEFHRVLGGN
jgi:hypothetical protein